MNAMKPDPVTSLSEAQWKERRNAVRHKATGSVSLQVPEETEGHFEGQLLDISSTGFRAVHANNHLRSGQECDFTLPGTRGKARVVWNRITPTHVETGFLILNYESA
jgi:hypothetical protein